MGDTSEDPTLTTLLTQVFASVQVMDGKIDGLGRSFNEHMLVHARAEGRSQGHIEVARAGRATLAVALSIVSGIVALVGLLT